MNGSVLVTGGSGFLGSYIVEELLNVGAQRILVLMRGDDDTRCADRLRRLWWRRPVLMSGIGSRIIPVAGDVTCENLGLDPDTYANLAKEVRLIVHTAAEVALGKSVDTYGDVNVTGTMHAVLFAMEARRAGGLDRFVHVSTAYVAGTRTGTIQEDILPDTRFNNFYEQSKHAAEQLVRDTMRTLPLTIIRPAQIVGDTQTGFVSAFNTLYYPLKLYLKGKLPVVPAARDMKVNLVPVDYVAQVTVRAAISPDAVGRTFHALTPRDAQPTVGELLDAVCDWSIENMGYDPGKPRCIPVPGAVDISRRTSFSTGGHRSGKNPLQNMLMLAPYFSEDRTYSTQNVENLLGMHAPAWHDYLGTLLTYATRAGFLNHTDRTVFEQMLVRTYSRTASIDYFDVSANGIAKTSGAEAHSLIERCASALRKHGIGHGDRVVLVGVNSVHYFIADAAVGLVGATGVPLYYTSPVDDIVELAKRSGAKLAFVGTEKLLDTLPKVLSIPVVSLMDKAPNGVMPWDTFLERGQSDKAGRGGIADDDPVQPPAFDDVATIRYTSGTTGKPKGVMFDFGQLAWMGAVMPSLIDWETRNGKMRYLSFLPMSHVVEGILVAYAPYYMLTDIEMYYLNDFSLLVETLPKVRPTLFFSVPRFYEKLWDQFEATGVGKRFVALPDGPAKRALAKIARTALLRKAGLDECKQLIVGSAPVSMDLLENFRSLGIEIHNAYGVTEAPLVALSRLGENELGSVGALLPETDIRLTDDGEILVSGPQVTVGYDGQGPCVDDEGFFATGDNGSLSEKGNLIIGGRKKELVITSYGKNVSPEKIETMLKAIPGVSEALLVGDSKPYVAALLWLEEDLADFDKTELDRRVEAMNERLSHPEQVKRWAVMDGRLTISDGDLTPNLKLRRRDVAEKHADTIEALYAEVPTAGSVPGVLHVGAAR